MWRPRMARIAAPSGSSRVMSTGARVEPGAENRISPDVMRAVLGRMPMIAWAVTDLPDPDSPTSATVVPVGMPNEIRSSAGTIVPRLSNSMERSRTSIRSAKPALLMSHGSPSCEAALRHPDLISQCCDPLLRGLFRSATPAGSRASERDVLTETCARVARLHWRQNACTRPRRRVPAAGRRFAGWPMWRLCRPRRRCGAHCLAVRSSDGGETEHRDRRREPVERRRSESVDLARCHRAPRASCGR